MEVDARDRALGPASYLRFADERSRRFADLLARVPGDARTIVDLGCGLGHLTPLLRARWPQAVVTGVDSSPEMVASARQASPESGMTYVEGDLRDWRPGGRVDLLVSVRPHTEILDVKSLDR